MTKFLALLLLSLLLSSSLAVKSKTHSKFRGHAHEAQPNQANAASEILQIKAEIAQGRQIFANLINNAQEVSSELNQFIADASCSEIQPLPQPLPSVPVSFQPSYLPPPQLSIPPQVPDQTSFQVGQNTNAQIFTSTVQNADQQSLTVYETVVLTVYTTNPDHPSYVVNTVTEPTLTVRDSSISNYLPPPVSQLSVTEITASLTPAGSLAYQEGLTNVPEYQPPTYVPQESIGSPQQSYLPPQPSYIPQYLENSYETPAPFLSSQVPTYIPQPSYIPPQPSYIPQYLENSYATPAPFLGSQVPSYQQPLPSPSVPFYSPVGPVSSSIREEEGGF